MYISAFHLNIKLKQDYADFSCAEDFKMLVICDGIGQFPYSDIVARTVCDSILDNQFDDLDQLIFGKDLCELIPIDLEAGTTIIFAKVLDNNELKIEYLGNGGCVHCDGAFAENENNLPIYRFNQLIMPHVNAKGGLVKHLSYVGGDLERKRTKMTFTTDGIFGDIFIFFSDGINSNENNIIIKDVQGRYWRNESSALMYILDKLDEFLTQNACNDNFQDILIDFNKMILNKLFDENLIDDDASLGFIIDSKVLDYYKSKLP